MIQKRFLVSKNTIFRDFSLFLGFFGPRIEKLRSKSLSRGYDFEHPLVGYLEIIWSRSEDLSLDKRLRSPKNPKLRQKWEKWGPFFDHFLDFFISSWSQVTSFFSKREKRDAKWIFRRLKPLLLHRIRSKTGPFWSHF